MLILVNSASDILLVESTHPSNPYIKPGTKADPLLVDYLLNDQGETKISQKLISGKINHRVTNWELLMNWYFTGINLQRNQKNIFHFLFLLTPDNHLVHLLNPLIQSFSKTIEENLLNKEKISQLNISKEYIDIISKSSKDGILCLDKEANIKYMNEVAGKILHVNPEKSLNQYIGEIVDFVPVVLSVFKTKKGYTDREFIIHSRTWGTLHFIKTAVIVKDIKGQFAGVVDFFREITRVRKFVTSYIGAQAKFNFNDLIGNNTQLRESIRIAKIAAQSNSNVLIIGETGTGKEMIAQAIHYEGNRKSGPFVTINCGAIPRDLAESEFFGYEPGSFTGADRKGRSGKFELANGGTIFLDEIEELPINLQIKLLRFIQERQITRIGGIKQIPVNVRIIAASNKDLQKEIQLGRFRKDLYHRINVIKINLPNLKNRKEDIPSLIEHLTKKLSLKLEKKSPAIDPSFIQSLLNYDFPGNVRELENIIERILNICDDKILTIKHIPKEIINDQNQTNYSLIEDSKRHQISSILLQTDWNISKAAHRLQLSRPTLYRYIKKWNLNQTKTSFNYY